MRVLETNCYISASGEEMRDFHKTMSCSVHECVSDSCTFGTKLISLNSEKIDLSSDITYIFLRACIWQQQSGKVELFSEKCVAQAT